MTNGSSKTLATTGSISHEFRSVAISSDSRLVAAGSSDMVHDLQSLVGMYSESGSCR